MQPSHRFRPATSRDYLLDLRTAHHTIILRRPRRMSVVVFSTAMLLIGAAGAYWIGRPAGTPGDVSPGDTASVDHRAVGFSSGGFSGENLSGRASSSARQSPLTSDSPAVQPDGAALFSRDPAQRERSIVDARRLLDPSLVPDLLTVFENEQGWREFVVAASDPDDGVLARFSALDRHERKLIVFALSGYRLENLRGFFEAVLENEKAPEIRRLATIAIYRLDRPVRSESREDEREG